MPVEEFTIREITGSKRLVRLGGRSLPYRPVEFEGDQAYVQTWYPGNPVATIQVLGPREGAMTIAGMWKTSKLVGAVQLEGFDDIPSDGGTVTAEDLVQVFHRLRVAGNTVEVRWGPELRRGIISRFTPTYHNENDVEWSVDFVWSQRGDAPPARAARIDDPVATTTASMNRLSDAAAAEPPGIIEQARDTVRTGVDAMRRGVSQFTQTVTQIQSTANVASARFQQLQAITRQIVDTGRSLRKGSLDLPYTKLLPIDDVVQVLKVENWRRDVGATTRRTSAQSVRGRDGIAARAVPGHLAIVTVRENQTLRSLAAEYYGSADAWTVIADANEIVGSNVAIGTVLVIPRPPAGAVNA